MTGIRFSLTGATGEAIGISLAASDTAIISDTGTITGTQVVTFSGANDTLVLDQPSTFTGTISGISGSTDVLDLQGFDTGAKVSYSGTAAGGTVTVSEGSTTVHLTVAGTGIGTFVSGGLDSSGTGLLIHDPPAGSGATTIDTGATLDLTGASAQNVTFANTTGTTGSLVLNDPEGFTGQIIGFTGTAPDAVHSDTIDLVGINYDSSGFAESYNSTTGLLTVTDGINTARITFDDFNATLDFLSDGNGGTVVTDPPASNSSNTTVSATFDWGMKFENDRIEFNSDQSVSQHGATAGCDVPKDPLVSLHDDNFLFHQDLGAEAGARASPHVDANELTNQANTPSAQELAVHLTPEPHHEAFVDFLNPSLPPSISPAQWHEHLANAFHLH